MNLEQRFIDAQEAKIGGVPVTLNESFRTGVLTIEISRGAITCCTSTLSWLEAQEQQGGATWRKIAEVLHQEIEDAGYDAMRTHMVDVGARVGVKVVDRRKVTRPNNDRVDHVSHGIADLVAQMAPFCDGRPLSGNQVRNFARRYGELRDEIALLRAALADAEGRFEIAQSQIVKLMEGQE